MKLTLPLFCIYYRRLFLPLYIETFTERQPHGIFTDGGAFMPTQEKKKKKHVYISEEPIRAYLEKG